MAGEALVRFGAFAAVLTAAALWEALSPARERAYPRLRRWPSNLGVVVVDTLLVRALFPSAVVGVAAFAEGRGWGLLNLVHAPAWLAWPIALVALDFTVWGQHVVFHRIPWLWRLHRMHHADLDYDVTTALRFHPGEIVLSVLVKMAAAVALGAPPGSVVAFEIVLNAFAMFNHANASLPSRLEPVARLLVVTPDMHRVHHSVEPAETNSNFGFNLSIWDRAFGLYRTEPAAGRAKLSIGLPCFRSPRELRLDRMLTQPWRRDRGVGT
ncbi:MAG: sterol desaturase family protein [Hyphomicrobiales bacterium]|nr:sterol desaturase family protein [Hyphomicrobiales bacterium]